MGDVHRTGTAPSRYGTLNRDAVVAAARKIADDEGLDQLTLRRVADALDTGPASIYRHISGRAQLLALLADDLAAGFPIVTPMSRETPADTVARQWRAAHRYLTAHAWGARVIAAGDQLAADAHRFGEHTLGLLAQMGIDEDDAARAYLALWHLLLGHLLNDHPFGHGQATRLPRRDENELDWAVRTLLAGLSVARPPAPRARRAR